MRSKIFSIVGKSEFSHPTMKVSVPARAPTTPPDMGESINVADGEEAWSETRAATEREVMGSIVEQSMKRRVSSVGGLGREEERIVSKTPFTWCGSGRADTIVSCRGSQMEL